MSVMVVLYWLAIFRRAVVLCGSESASLSSTLLTSSEAEIILFSFMLA